MLDKAGIHIRRVENGYITHEYSEDKDWVWQNIGEVVSWLIKKDVEIRYKEQYEIYCKNARTQDVSPMKFEDWKKNPIIAPMVSSKHP